MFSATGLNSATNYYIDYGDGSAAQPLTLNPPPCAYGVDCSNSYTANSSHTYTAAGIYTASIVKNYCPPGTYCFVPSQIVATTKVSVSGNAGGGGGGSTNFSADPSSGTPPLTVVFTVQNAVSGNTYYIDYGDGTTGKIMPSCTFAGSSCGGDATGSHTYTSAGIYTATLSHSINCQAGYSCPTALIQDGKVTITVAENGQGGFGASPTSGAAPLTVSFSASQPGVVSFGDGTSGTLYSSCNLAGSSCGGPYSTSHTYNTAGIYTATLKRETGQTSLQVTPIYETVGTVTITVTSAPTLLNGKVGN
jgi:PKD repeat protein